MAVNIIEFHGDEKRYVDALLKAQERTRELENELVKTNKAAADAANQTTNTFKQTEAQQASLLGKLRAQLAAIGPEGSAAAKAFSQSMASGGQTTEAAVESVIDKIRQINPEAAAAASAGFKAAQGEIAEAAKYSEGAFQKPLDKLRAMGPEGRKAADMLKASLVEAGKIGERSMGDIIDELRKIDPEAAAAAEKIQMDLDGAAKKASMSWQEFGIKAINSVTGIAASYVSLQSAVQLVNQYLADQIRLQNEAKDVQVTFGAAQQATLANLAGMSKSDQDYLVGEALDKISKDAKFGDRTKLMQAIGAVASAGVEDKDKIVSIVTAAAKSTNLNPDQLKGNAVAAAAIMAQAGLKDPGEALALATTAGPLSKIEDLSRLARVLPVALSAVGANTKGLTPQEAAKEGTAMFSLVGQAAQDELGESTRTFMVGFSGKLNTFFTEITENRAKAMDDIANIEERIAKGKETETDKLNLPKLQAFLEQSANLTDSGGLISRVEQLQNLPGVAALFKEKTTVEQQFQPSLGRLLNPNDPLLGEIKASVGKLSTDAAQYEVFASRMQNATRQIQLATAADSFEANFTSFQQSPALSAAGKMGQIREIQTKTNASLRASLGSGKESFMNYATDWPSFGSLSGGSAGEEAGSLIVRLLRQRHADSMKPQNDEVRSRSQFIDKQIAILLREFIATASPTEAREIQRTLGIQLGGLRAEPTVFADQFERDVRSNPQFSEMINLLQTISDKLTTENTPMLGPISGAAGS